MSTDNIRQTSSEQSVEGGTKPIVVRCFSDHHSYYSLPTNGKKKAFQKGWEAAQQGLSKADCPYEARIKRLVPTNPYYKYWHLGFECCPK